MYMPNLRIFWWVGLVALWLTACNPLILAPTTPTPLPLVAENASDVRLLPSEPPTFSTAGWKTDFSRRIVPWEQILSGGPPKDGIPSIDQPTFADVAVTGEWLSPRDPVILFQHNSEVRAYPLAILIWHEIVNDEVGGLPVTITFCPLCNASIVFDRTFQGQVLDFGTTGRLRNSDLVMYDRQTETWWQQFTGEGLVGQFAGEQLTFLGSQVISFGDFAQNFPDGQVLQIPDFRRDYGRNPYIKYDSGQPFLYDGELDPRLPPTERVMGVALGDHVVAYPFPLLAERQVVNTELGDAPLALFHKSGVASALDDFVISEGRDVGGAAVFSRKLAGRTLTFSAAPDGHFTDAETASTWNILGKAVAGELQGSQLEQVIAFDHFWFAWSAFYPETQLGE